MPTPAPNYPSPNDGPHAVLREGDIESGFISTLQGLKLEKNFRVKFDAPITAETQKHKALKTHKKALMQQLFPSPGH